MITPETIAAGAQIGTLVAVAPFITAATPIATKLIDVISKGLGTVYSPVNTFLNEKAQVAGLKGIKDIIEEIDGDITIKRGDFEVTLSNTDINERALTTMISKSIKEQINIEEIVTNASNLIESKINNDYEKISSEEVSEEWSIRFFEMAKNIRDEEMKNLWSSILADEIIKPGSYKLRTLDILRNMSKEDAKLFIKLSNISLDISHSIIIPQSDYILNKYGITFIDKVDLDELNLIHRDLSYTINPNEERFIMFGDDKCIIIKNTSDKKISLEIIKLTNAGKDVYRLTNPTYELEHLKEIGKGIQSSNDNLEVYYTDAKLNDDQSIEYNTNLNKVE